MAKTSTTIDLSSMKKAYDDSSKVATNYIDFDATNGLRISQSGDYTKPYVQIVNSGVNIIKDSTHKVTINNDSMNIYVGDASNAIATFGSTLRIGKTSTSNVTITPTGSTAGISFKADSSKILAEFAVDTTDSSATSEGWPMAAWFTLGNRAGVKGYYSLAGGYNITAKGWASFGYGIDCEAYGDTSIAIGNGCRTGASNAGIHQGDSNLAGWCSAAIGSSCVAHGNSQVVVGGANIIDTAHNYVFIIGNGTTSARSDALRVDWNGGIQMYLDSNGTSSANATSGTDKDLFNAIRTLGWYSAVIS